MDNPQPSHAPDFAVNIALVLTVETAQGLREALPRALKALRDAEARATVCLHIGRDAGAPAGGRWLQRARWHGWASLARGRLWPGADLARLAPAALAAIAKADCEAGLRLGASRRWRGQRAAASTAAACAQFRQLCGLAADAPLVVNFPNGQADWPLLRLMQGLGAGVLTGAPGRGAFMPSHHAELLAVPMAASALPSLSAEADAVAALLALSAASAEPMLCQLDVERVGGVWLEQFIALLSGWRQQGRQLIPVSDCLAGAPALPHAELNISPRNMLSQGELRFLPA